MKKVEERNVCEECFSAIANGDTSNLILLGENEAERIEALINDGIEEILSTVENGYLSPGTEEDEFSIYPCECCNRPESGARFEVVLLA